MNRTSFAKAVGASYVATYDWTNDKFAPRAEYLQRIAEATGYSASDLLGTANDRESGEVPSALAEFVETNRAASDITDKEFAQLVAFQWPEGIVPSSNSYLFALLAIRAQLSPEDAKEAIRVSEAASGRAVAAGIKEKPPKRRN